jgi:hypothetical protein
MILPPTLSDKEKAQRICAEFARMQAERASFEPGWKEAQHFVSSVELSFSQNEGEDTQGYTIPKRITNLPANYLDTLVSGICGYAVNPNLTWLKLGLFDKKSLKSYGVKDWLEDVEEAEYEEFNANNLYIEIKMLVESAAVYGFGIMLIDEDIINKNARYKTISVPEVYLDTNEYDEYETVFRCFYMTVENAVAWFSIEKMAETIKSVWNTESGSSNSSRNNKIKILHAVFRRKNGKGVSERTTEMPFASFYVDISNQHIIMENGYRSFPYAIFSWDRIGVKKYPISPSIKAINDVKLLNKTEESRLTLAKKSADPAMNVPETMRGRENFGPGGYNYFDKSDMVASQLQAGANYPITVEITNQQAENIKDWFYVDFFLMLQAQGNLNQMTATAVQALQGEKAAVMTNMIVNLEKCLRVIVQRTFDIMARQNRLPDMPQALMGRQNRLDFTFSGVLSQIQKSALRYQGAARFLSIANPIANLGQAYPPALEAFDRFDFEVILKNEARAANLSEMAIREDDDVEAIRQARMQAAAAQAQAAQEQEQQKLLAQNYNKLNQPVQPNSPAEALQGAG